MNLKQICNHFMDKAKRIIYSGICSYCENTFYAYHTYPQPPKFCSTSCMAKHRYKYNWMKCKCLTCGNEFTRKKTHYKASKKHFCKLSCYVRLGADNPNWKNGTQMNNGYKCIRIGRRYFFEHRYIMAKHLKRPLRQKEIVHHINHNKLDNRLKNLQVMTISDHMKLHQHYRHPK